LWDGKAFSEIYVSGHDALSPAAYDSREQVIALTIDGMSQDSVPDKNREIMPPVGITIR
jgi:hypothetical protein